MKILIEIKTKEMEQSLFVEVDETSKIKMYCDPTEPNRYQEVTFNIVKRFANKNDCVNLVDTADAYIGSGKNDDESIYISNRS